MTRVNNAASIHQRILNKANTENRPFNELLQYYAIERFLYRLGESPHYTDFVLKGALVFLAWHAPLTRPTRDMDFLGYTDNSVENLIRVVHEVCLQPVDIDGLIFEPTSVKGEIIKEGVEYPGVRISFWGFLGKAQIHMRLDIGFADIVTPPHDELEFPTLLTGMSKPCIRAYPPETVIAEKFQAMVALGMVNSRMKDFYDLWFMAKSMEFDYILLKEAISKTFDRRKTVIPIDHPSAFSKEFVDQKQSMWIGFLKKNQIGEAPNNIYDVIVVLIEFFAPIIHPNESQYTNWQPTIGWVK